MGQIELCLDFAAPVELDELLELSEQVDLSPNRQSAQLLYDYPETSSSAIFASLAAWLVKHALDGTVEEVNLDVR